MPEYRANTRNDLTRIGKMLGISRDQIADMQAVSAVLPFKANDYVVKDLIDGNNLPADPIFQLTFPQKGMLPEDDFKRMRDLISQKTSEAEILQAASEVRQKLNPHPAGQMEFNKPKFGDDTLEGMQHKYNETLLFFPAQGQTCHAYCTYCFRWAQFIGDKNLKFASKESGQLVKYVRDNPQISSVLITGGDPMMMKTKFLRQYIDPLLDIPHLDSIRVGTKALAYWPYRFTQGEDADDFLRLIEKVRAKDKHFALMAHSSHPRELEPAPAREALRRVISTGATVYCQAPLIKHVNDHQDIWADLWRKQVQLGAVPYYMFIERDTGPKNYFEVPLARAFNIFTRAYRQVSGLSRTVRGPSMSATPGKALIDGITEIAGERIFVLKFIQGRNPDWVNRVFFAKFDSQCCWLDELKPAFGEDSFFYETEMEKLKTKENSRKFTSFPNAAF